MTKRKRDVTPSNLLTPVGAAAAVWTLTTFLQQGFGLPGRQVAPVLSILFGLMIAWQTMDRQEIMTWVSALVLGASIYLTAMGGNVVGVTAFTDNAVTTVPESVLPPPLSNLQTPEGPQPDKPSRGFTLELWR